jgi:Arc/MetJ-type ribon-helix-helix transcriptional regulator
MSSDRVNARLPLQLAQHVERVVGPKGYYETSSEYIRSLIRQDMQSTQFRIFTEITEGFEDIAQGRTFESTGDWKKDKAIFEEKR